MLHVKKGLCRWSKAFPGVSNVITWALKSGQEGQKSQRDVVEERAGEIQSVTGTHCTVAGCEDRGGQEPGNAGASGS